MSDTENKALQSLQQAFRAGRLDEILSSIPPENRQAVAEFSYAQMVRNLVKPGADIKATLTDRRLTTLLVLAAQSCALGDQIDAVKKVVVYNKPNDDVHIFTEAELEKAGLPLIQAAGLSEPQADLMHMMIGVVGETGEIAEAVLKNVAEGQAIDLENVREEVGDILFYLQGIANNLGFSLEEAMMANKVKLLGKRYASGGYTDAAAQARADKVEVPKQ